MLPRSPRAHTRRRTLAVLGLAAAISLAWPDPAPAQPAGPVQPAQPARFGRAVAQASTVAIVPEVGGLPVPVLFGAAAADVSASRARARAIDIDVGVLGVLATTEICGAQFFTADQLPQPVRAASPDGPAEASRDRASIPAGELLTTSVDHLAARAAPDPSSEAMAQGSTMTFGGAVTVVGGEAHAGSRTVDGVREAVATVDYGEIVVGPVRLEGVHTEAFHRSGAADEVGTRFRIGAMEVAGQRFEPPADADPATVLDPANAVLAALGVTIAPPREEVVGSTARLRPLEVRFGESALSGPVFSPLLGALQPLRDEVSAALDGDCGASSVFTLADVVTGVASGAGGLAFQFGAVEASTGEVTVTSPFGSGVGPAVLPSPMLPPAPAATAARPSLSAVTPAPVAAPETPAPPAVAGPASPISTVLDAPAGRAWLAIALALPVLLLLAGRDWWVMRSSTRSLVERS